MRFLGKAPQPADLVFLARRVGRRQMVGGLEHAHRLGAAEPLGQEIDQRRVDIVDRLAVADSCSLIVGSIARLTSSSEGREGRAISDRRGPQAAAHTAQATHAALAKAGGLSLFLQASSCLGSSRDRSGHPAHDRRPCHQAHLAGKTAHHLLHHAAPLPPPIAFIMSAMPRCILRSLLISLASVPEPAAMRFLRECLRMSGLARSAAGHRGNDGDLALDGAVVHAGHGQLVLHLAKPGIMPMMPPSPPIFCIWRSWVGEIVEIELALGHLGGHGLGLLGIDRFGSLLDQRDDVAHAEDAVSDAAGMELVEFAIFSPVPISLTGLPVTARIDSAAPPRPSHPCGSARGR